MIVAKERKKMTNSVTGSQLSPKDLRNFMKRGSGSKRFGGSCVFSQGQCSKDRRRHGWAERVRNQDASVERGEQTPKGN